MEFSWTAPKHAKTGDSETAERSHYIARQPIMDLRGCVHGYELLFYSTPDLSSEGVEKSAQSACALIDNSLLFGVENLAAGVLAFFSCAADAIAKRLVDALPAERSVLEISASVSISDELIENCRKLKRAGFRIALDRFEWKQELQPLLEIADYVKVDFKAVKKPERLALCEKLAGLPVTKIALGVETHEILRHACKEGFTLLQGYYFCRPAPVKSRRIPANRLSQMAILELLRQEPLDMRAVSGHLKHDAALTYRLLRLVNSPLYTLRERICSIEAALLIAGEDAFRRLAMLAITSELGSDQPLELLRMAIVRARFCELESGVLLLDATEQYLLGLLSLIPAILRMPAAALASTLPLREEIKDALKGKRNSEHALLQWIKGLENGDWEICERVARRFSLDRAMLVKHYSQAVLWAESALSAAS